MRATTTYGPGDIRVEDRDYPDPRMPDDVVVKVSAACVCGSDLWPDGPVKNVNGPASIGHVGVVESVGRAETELAVGAFVIAPCVDSCGRCPQCLNVATVACDHIARRGDVEQHGFFVHGAQGHAVRVPQAVPGRTVVVVGDGAVGLCGVLAAKRLGATRLIAMSRQDDRTALATAFGARANAVRTASQKSANCSAASWPIRSSNVSARRNPLSRPCTARGRAEAWDSSVCRRACWNSAPLPVRLHHQRGRRHGLSPNLRPRAARGRAQRLHQSRAGFRFRHAAGAGSRGLRGHGLAPGHQGHAQAVKPHSR